MHCMRASAGVDLAILEGRYLWTAAVLRQQSCILGGNSSVQSNVSSCTVSHADHGAATLSNENQANDHR